MRRTRIASAAPGRNVAHKVLATATLRDGRGSRRYLRIERAGHALNERFGQWLVQIWLARHALTCAAADPAAVDTARVPWSADALRDNRGPVSRGGGCVRGAIIAVVRACGFLVLVERTLSASPFKCRVASWRMDGLHNIHELSPRNTPAVCEVCLTRPIPRV